MLLLAVALAEVSPRMEAGEPKPAKTKNDIELLEGKWSVASYQFDGEDLGPVSEWKYTFLGNTLRMKVLFESSPVHKDVVEHRVEVRD